ncbi:MAG TPA: biotin/lipoyl-containing protein, partial [Clostridia bacterium]|nr:biotin/lipoyl-containing protein [Clostridia bacterium]
PCVEYAARECGITHFEAGGGALFQSPFFYSNENAFDVMDAFRKAAGPNANLQTLARGISVVALKAQPRDVVKLHADMFKKHGMTTIRNFDALNDYQNLIWSGQCITNAGLKHEVTVTMMELPPGCAGAHEVDFYEKTLRDILDSGLPYASVCFKDASGTSRPQKVYETIKMARRLLGDQARIAFHSHETAGTCTAAYKAAVEAGVSQIDLALAPVSGGTSQPDLITMWHALRGTDYTLDVDVNKIIRLEQMFKDAMKDYFVPPEATQVEPLIPFFPMPGGALTANTQMLRDNNLMDKYSEVIEAMGEAVKKGGFGTSVTPVSQFYFQQAFNNVMFGPWKKIADGYGKMVLGYFGKTPVPPDPEVVKIASEQLKVAPTTDHLTAIEQDAKRGIAATRAVLEKEGLPATDENLFIVASCEEKGVAFLKGQGTIGVRKNQPKTEAKTVAPAPVQTKGGALAYNVSIGGQNYRVVLDGKNALVNGTSYAVDVSDAAEEAVAAAGGSTPSAGQPLATQLPGLVLRVEKPVGSKVKSGDTVLVIESMKMENAICSPVDGTIREVLVKQGEQVQAGQKLGMVG